MGGSIHRITVDLRMFACSYLFKFKDHRAFEQLLTWFATHIEKINIFQSLHFSFSGCLTGVFTTRRLRNPLKPCSRGPLKGLVECYVNLLGEKINHYLGFWTAIFFVFCTPEADTMEGLSFKAIFYIPKKCRTGRDKKRLQRNLLRTGKTNALWNVRKKYQVITVNILYAISNTSLYVQ